MPRTIARSSKRNVVRAMDEAKSAGRRVGWTHRLAAGAAWSTFVAFHALALAYFGFSAYCYWVLPDTIAENFLRLFRIGLGSENYHAIAATYSAVALVHVVFLLQMTVLSIRQRRLVFALGTLPTPDARSKVHSPIEAARRAIQWVYATFFTPTGLLGISGPCFDLLLLFREVLETTLQTIQAYRMSQSLARVWLNRFYVGLLVLNCWLVAFAHTLFHRSSTIKYFSILLCDFALDLVSSMLIQSVIALIYARDAQPDSNDWFGEKWFDDVWIVNATNELQLLLVTSLADLAARVVFALGMISNLNTLKRFVSAAVDPTAKEGWRQRWDTIVPEPQRSPRYTNFGATVLARTNHALKSNRVLTRLLRVAFAVWGSVVLTLHVLADSSWQVPQCVMQVRPWAISLPSCNFVLINCHQEQILGRAAEIHERIQGFYLPSIAVFQVYHCPGLEMPPLVQSLSGLASVKIYNTTIAEWGQEAALTNVHNPFFFTLRVIRSTVVDGLLPLGLQADDFPRRVNILLFIHTNLIALPDDLDLKWPQGATAHFDTAQFTEVPEALLRMKPKTLQLAGNPLKSVPKELFELSGPEYLDLRDTNISSLPADVENPSSTLESMNLDRTSVSSFPAWMNEWLTYPGDPIFMERISAAGSRYCAEREQVFAGSLDSFTSLSAQSVGSQLMDASRENWVFLARTVACTPSQMYRYPLDLEDMLSALP